MSVDRLTTKHSSLLEDPYTDQKIQEFKELLKTVDVIQMIGGTGNGKTFMVGRITKDPDIQESSIELMAPTGRAAKILSEKTQRKAKTVHSVLYDVDEESSEPGFIAFKLKKGGTDKNIFICDEANMLGDTNQATSDSDIVFGSEGLLSDLFKYSNVKERNNCCLVFVGDHSQLPPVGERFSGALSKEYLESKFGVKVGVIELTKNYRHKNNAELFDFIKQFRSKGVF